MSCFINIHILQNIENKYQYHYSYKERKQLEF